MVQEEAVRESQSALKKKSFSANALYGTNVVTALKKNYFRNGCINKNEFAIG